jgi:hypothetical protein
MRYTYSFYLIIAVRKIVNMNLYFCYPNNNNFKIDTSITSDI